MDHPIRVRESPETSPESDSDRALLERVARQLYDWAEESQRGGWSTHQVEAQRRLADSISRHLTIRGSRGG